ncbi:DNA excision repair protein ERCC-1 [Amphibalanus amphitrite]|uniref:DNA excision repair protein ERCC-1 n=2 Tax=Amphibalanus amphitrite TaxID=1232801 RepID=A0A6A4VGT7_AMPAM|nr:DNA excision repair protein ERCC-1-like isoform X1 [Amphibalanus amphitrite]XP_043202536.1 DNA excision repair protein ERCC-1-like isoform X1 [Amphibalanus amphitrite]KAF0292359.1 DNA excision repair protein ERCC-1 [Amphibalanus amphitrite]
MASSEFGQAFEGLKSSEFYEPPPTAPPAGTAGSGTGSGTGTGTARSIGSGYSILVNHRQRGNPVLKAICSVPWEFSDIQPDYVLGAKTCALFLSLRYHQLNPGYAAERVQALGSAFELRVLLVQVDVREPHHALKELTRLCLRCDMTLMLAWSADEAGRILDTYKAYEHKSAELIREPQSGGALAQVTDALTSVRSVNRSDAAALLNAFGSLAHVIRATEEELALCTGIGPSKAKRLYEVLHMPVRRTGSPTKRK